MARWAAEVRGQGHFSRRGGLWGGAVLDGPCPASVEPVLQDHAAGRNTLMKLSAWADLHLFHRPVVNEVVPSDGMLLGFNAYETPDPAVIDNQAQAMAGQLAQLRDVVEGYGGHFYYVAVPGQYTYFSDSYPDFLNSREAYTALEIPAFTQAMEAQGVNLLDMGPVLDQLGIPRSTTPWPTTTTSSRGPM